MGLREFEKAAELIQTHGGDFEGAKEEQLVAAAEQALGIDFPPSYRAFLLRFGCGDIEGLEFYGLIDDDFRTSSIPNSIWLTLQERESGLPDHLVLIFSTGDGTYYALDTKRTQVDGECAVVSYDVSGNSSYIADDFGTFLLSELQAVLV